MTRVTTDIDRNGTAGVEVVPLDRDSGSSGEGSLSGLDAGEVWRLRKNHKIIKMTNSVFIDLFNYAYAPV